MNRTLGFFRIQVNIFELAHGAILVLYGYEPPGKFM